MTKENVNWADKLIEEYEQSRSKLAGVATRLDAQTKRLQAIDAPVPKKLKEEKSILNSMMENMTFAMDWMKSGRNPDAKRGVDKRAIYQRQFFESLEVIPDITDQLYDIDSKQLYMTQQEKEKLAKIFASWSHRERYCYIAHTVEGKSWQTIAEELNVSKSSVQTHISRARKKVEKVLAQ